MQNLCSFNVINWLISELIQIFNVLLRFDSIKRIFDLAEYVDYKTDKVLILVTNPSVEINNLIGLLDITLDNEQVTNSLQNISYKLGSKLLNICWLLRINDLHLLFFPVFGLHSTFVLFFCLQVF